MGCPPVKVFWWITFASAGTKQAGRTKTNVRDPGKSWTQKKKKKSTISAVVFFFPPHQRRAAPRLCAAMTHVSVWASICVCYLRWCGRGARPAGYVWSLLGEVAPAEWSWPSHIVPGCALERKCRLNVPEHNAHSLISAANAPVIETPAGGRFHLVPRKWSGAIVRFCFLPADGRCQNRNGGSFEKQHNCNAAKLFSLTASETF